MANRKKRRVRWDRVAVVFIPLFLLILIIAHGCSDDENEQSSAADTQVQAVTTAEPFAENLPTATTAVTVETEAVQTYYDELVICVDAGHGGEDGGAVNQTQTRAEKDDNLALALATRDAFLKYPKVRVVMTRETDVFIELQERCDIANNNHADFFISLHRNSAQFGNGVEIWINNDSGSENTWDKLMAEYIMDWLADVGISERRGIHTGFRNSTVNHESNNYYVNRYTNMPSCLIEMGFMTSAVDNSNFDRHKAEYADAIAGAVIELLTDKGLYDPELAKTAEQKEG